MFSQTYECATRYRLLDQGGGVTDLNLKPHFVLPSRMGRAMNRRSEATDPAGAMPPKAEPEIVALCDRVRDSVTLEALFHELTLATSKWDFDPNAIEARRSSLRPVVVRWCRVAAAPAGGQGRRADIAADPLPPP